MHKTLSAQVALELRIDVVNSPMHSKGTVLTKGFPAYVTDKRLFTGMNAFVANETTFFCEAHLAKTAFVGLLASVASFVRFQARRLRECQFTHAAFKRLLTRVNEFVSFETAKLRKPQTA